MTVYSASKKNPKALRVDLMFTVESQESVSCGAMITLFLVLMKTADVDEESSRRDRRYRLLKFASDEAAG